ncbi:unnamed protein product [Fusarium fujikuroi]|nr:unnamed protein product [Fusarium fujikuroi]
MYTSTLLLTLVASANAHIASWNKGMYCKGGNDSSVDNANTNLAVNPLYDLPKSKWWMQADRGCDAVPPPKGEFLELPAGKSFMTELANNRAFTTLSYKGELTTEWQDGKNRSMPWRGYQQADMPACPEEGCYCAWLWIPDGCGQPNMYMQNHRCKVTGSTSTKKLGKPKPPVYCRDNPTKCVPGPKQMMAWNQAEGNNVNPPNGKTPTYNQRMGFMDGAQDDIFVQK